MKWTTKEGKEMVLSEMDDNHLLNAYKMVKTQSHDIDFTVDTMPDELLPATALGEMRRLHYYCCAFEKEIKKRNLTPHYK